MNHNFHAGPADNPHRFLNVLLRGTYVRPHRHLQPPKAESFLVLYGEADVILFDDIGTITQRYRLGVGSPGEKVWGIDLEPGVWHTVVAVTDRVVCFEVKPGPWHPSADKEFASWAPEETDSRAVKYLQELTSGAEKR